MIDSLNGYQAAMPEEQFLVLHLHELLQYLNRQGAATFLTVAQHGMMGDMKQPIDVTYLADSVIMLRYFEALGRVRRALSVIKKRTGTHEDTIREFRISNAASRSGRRSSDFQGVLRGVPTYVGGAEPLLTGEGLNFTGTAQRERILLSGAARPRCRRRQGDFARRQAARRYLPRYGGIDRRGSGAARNWRSSPKRQRATAAPGSSRPGSPRSRHGRTFHSCC